MNRGFRTSIAALLAVMLALPVVALARVAIDVKASDTLVNFVHARHMRSDCSVCHTTKPTASPPVSPVRLNSSMNCQKCHDLRGEEEPPSEGCTNCHNDIDPQ